MRDMAGSPRYLHIHRGLFRESEPHVFGSNIVQMDILCKHPYFNIRNREDIHHKKSQSISVSKLGPLFNIHFENIRIIVNKDVIHIIYKAKNIF